jgi:cell division transport system permease protein
MKIFLCEANNNGAFMKNGKKIARITSALLKFVTLTFLGFFFVFVANHYYQIKNYAKSLSEDLNIFVFFDKNSNNDEKILESLTSAGSVLIKEYVDATEAYKKVVEKNPLLSNISLPNDEKSIQAYAIVKPQSIPDNDFLLEMKNTLEGIDGVDEVVFDVSDFIHYANIQKQLLIYEKVFCIVISVFFAFLLLKSVLVYIAGADMSKKGINFLLYLLLSSLGFLLFWTVCRYMHYSLLVPKITIMLMIPFISVMGFMFDKIEKE